MGTGNLVKTDLYSLYDYVQNANIVVPKELFIETLRNFFAEDSYYHYVKDEFGFPKVTDHTNLPKSAGVEDDTTTRLYIGEMYRYDVIYYPSLLVRHTGSHSVPVSMSRNKDIVQWEATRYIDGYGHETIIRTPAYFIQAGAWEGSLAVDIKTRSMRSRDELADLISVHFVDTAFEDLYKAGVIIKSGSPKVGSPSEEDDRNDKLFTVTVDFEIRTEWRRHIPIHDVVDAINICVEIGNLSHEPELIAPNIAITTSVDVIEAYSNL